jgi:hypothetical protein
MGMSLSIDIRIAMYMVIDIAIDMAMDMKQYSDTDTYEDVSGDGYGESLWIALLRILLCSYKDNAEIVLHNNYLITIYLQEPSKHL